MSEENNLRVLFVCSGNSNDFEIVPFIKSQGDSLIREGVTIDYFLIKGKGIKGYLNNVIKLKKFLRQNHFDIIHSHYILSAVVALLSSFKHKHVVSYMGSDSYGIFIGLGKIKKSSYINIILSKLLCYFVDWIIVKSQNILSNIPKRNNISVIANGVDIEKFKPLPMDLAREKLKLKSSKKYIYFAGDKKNLRKNFKLAEEAVKNLNDENIELINPFPISHEEVNLYFNACDVLLLTSINEGSPNVIKEAMAANTPIVTTPVGDVNWLLNNLEGTFISDFNPEHIADDLKKALEFSIYKSRTLGRERLIELKLDSKSVATKILSIYKKVLNK